MNYEQTVNYLYEQLPSFQKYGSAAIKEGLGNIKALCEHLGNPQTQFKSIHVAGTNGKGSSSHMIASVLQASGYKTGLFTSPHLKNFTERIRLDGAEIPQDFVVDFVNQNKEIIDKIQPSFFELSTAMAFDFFAKNKVDMAIIEVGLGGRLDSTNIILPQISLITSISYDHQDVLGNTLPEIAGEKAGIIKNAIPVVISVLQEEIAEVFVNKAKEVDAPIYFASNDYQISFGLNRQEMMVKKQGKLFMDRLSCELKGFYQEHNIKGVLKVIELLDDSRITKAHIRLGLEKVATRTGLKGRWQILNRKPLTICDTAHNEDGIKQISTQLQTLICEKLHFVFGVMKDKNLEKIVDFLPKNAIYYCCQADSPRAMKGDILTEFLVKNNLQAVEYQSVKEAINQAKQNANQADIIFIGGSNLVVAEIEDL